MKKLLAPLLLLLSLLYFSEKCTAQLQVIEYKLDNGLTVILNPDTFQNEVSGSVAVNTGSKNDPYDASGMAHYLEHLLFKGTAELGTADFEKEKPHLDSIRFYYDQLGETEEDEIREQIQLKINEHAIEASKYGMPNEFDKLLKSIGSTRINATTSSDLTIYYNKFPPNQMHKWLDIYAHRFIDPVFRSFQSELEVVYEEKNRAADNMERRIFEAYNSAFYKGHPYGEKNTLGTIEHLKNPSLTKMYEYFEKYYVANNMALILSGNFKVEEVKPIIKETFGKLKNKVINDSPIQAPTPFNGRELVKKRITPIKFGILGFRLVPAFHQDELALETISYLFQNESGTGLIDELKSDNKIMMGFSFANFMDEAGGQVMVFVPKVFVQSLKSAEKLVLEQIQKVKDGNFSDELFNSVKNEMYKNYQLQLEDLNTRGYLFANIFRANKTWKDIESYPDRISGLTKEKIIEAANKYYTDNYLVFHSKTGFPKKSKLDKPKFKAVQADQSRESAYAKRFEEIEELPIQNKFIDFKNDLDIIPLKDSSQLYVVKNPFNDIFELSIRFHQGTIAEPRLEMLANFLNYAHPIDESMSDYKTKIALLGSQFSFASGTNFFELNITGVEKNLNQVLAEINRILTDPHFDEKSLTSQLNDYKTDRKVEMEDASLIARAMAQYGIYGKNAPLLNRASMDEIKAIGIADYKTIYTSLLEHSVSVHYSGKIDAQQVKAHVIDNLALNFDGKSNVPYYQQVIEREKNEVLIINNKKLVQSQLFFIERSDPFELDEYPQIELFNTYFSGGFSGILTQEIREYRSLAYSTGAKYRYSTHPKVNNYFYTYVGCQGDKTVDAASEAYKLIKDLPKKPERMANIQKNLSLNQLSNYPSFRNLSTTVELYQLKGFTKDPNELASKKYSSISFDDLYLFYEKRIQNKSIFLGIYGDSKRFDQEELLKIGAIKEIKIKDVITF